MEADISKLIESLKADIVVLAKATLKDYINQATKDGQQVIEDWKGDITRWAEKLAKGELSEADVRFLAEGQKELMHMKKLEQAGLTKIELVKFRNGIVDLIVTAISKWI